jgi:hypothetical protein
MDVGRYSYLSLHARMQRRGKGRRQVQTMTVIATGIRPGVHREVLGQHVLTSADANAWTNLLRRLVARGLSGVRLVIATSHPGLKAAVAEVLPNAHLQRCRVHALNDLLMLVPEPTKPLVATMVRSIYAQTDPAAVSAQHARVIEQLREGFPDAAAMLAEAGPDLLAFASFPRKHWPQIWSTNPRQVLDRSDGVGILHHHPNFFVLTTVQRREHRRADNSATYGEEQHGQARATAQAPVGPPNPPASMNKPSRTGAFLSPEELRALYSGYGRTNSGRVPTNPITTSVASTIGSIVNTVAARAGDGPKYGGRARAVTRTAPPNPLATTVTRLTTGALPSLKELDGLHRNGIIQSRHLLANLTTQVSSTIDSLANTFPRRLGLRLRVPATVATIRVPGWVEIAMVITGLAVALAAHAINVFFYPRYELDEGTYMSSAWAILNGQITPYPYGYGHPPLGWMQIAAWTQLTGGFFTFGNALNSGRVLMLFYTLGSSCLVYLITHRISGRRATGLLAMILFSLSPLSLVYQRQVFLDNIGVFWLLLSLFLIVAGKSRLSYVVPAGLAYGCALLSKETFVLFVPVMILAMWLHTTKYQHTFGLVAFAYSVIALGSTFLLMAVLKGELFPYAWHLPWDRHPHLSLLDTFAHQALRTQTEGKLGDSWYTWTHGDPLLMTLSIVAPIFNLIFGLRSRNQLCLALAALSYWALLLRGGVVLSFYVIVLIPLVALNAAFAANTIMTWIGRLVRVELICTLLIVVVAGGVLVSDIRQSENAFTQHSTSAQTQSMVWIRNHVPHNSVVVINSYLYMDLRQPGGVGVGDGATYPYADVYWNIAYDPELHTELLQNNWDRIDYIVADSEMMHDITTAGEPMLLIETALHHSILREEFRANENSNQIVISIFQVVHKDALTPTMFPVAADSPDTALAATPPDSHRPDRLRPSTSVGLLPPPVAPRVTRRQPN